MTKQITVQINSNDDLMTRAEKIVKIVGYTGAVSGIVIDVYRLLQKYEKLDKEQDEK